MDESLSVLRSYKPPLTTRRYVLVDVFSAQVLAGNQLAVVLDGTGLATELMQDIAREFNVSETVFLLAADDADALVRIFTPRVELPFAGHPLLGSGAVVSWAFGRDDITLLTAKGKVQLTFRQAPEGGAFGTMQQPIPAWEPFGATDALLDALGVRASALPVEVYTNGPQHAFVALEDDESVARLEPDLAALEALGAFGVSCFAGAGRHWKTRMFAPGIGVAEDPATGSAAGPLALHLARHGRIGFGDEIEIRQGEELDRPSRLFARVVGSAERVERIEVSGAVVPFAAGALIGGVPGI